MSFALPWALAFFALFVPVILLYLLKQRRRHVQVSSLHFWERILRDEQKVTAYTKLRKILSLLLLLLFISLLALALARPLFSKELLGARRIVVLLDVSASMTAEEDGTTRFVMAVEHAHDVVRGMAFGDSMMIVAFADSPEVLLLFTSSRTALHGALDAAEPTHNGTDLDAALELLDELPPGSRKTHVYLISDGAYPSVEITPPEETWFAYLPVGEAKDNVGVTAMQARPLPGAPRDFEVFFEAFNAGEKEVRAPYELRAGGRLVDAGELILPPGASETRMLRQYTREGGVLTLYIDHKDAFPLDNTGYAVLPPVRPIRVVLVTAGNLFLEQALATDPGVDLEVYTPEAYDIERPRAAVVVFDRVARLAPRGGASIHLGAWPADFELTAAEGGEDRIVTGWDRDHRVMRHLSLDNITIREAPRVTAPESYAVLVQSFEAPLVLFRETESGPRLVITFDATASDLPLRAAFPMMMANSVRFLAGVDARETWAGHDAGALIPAETMAAYIEGLDKDEAVYRVLAPGEKHGDEEAPENATALAPSPWLASRVGVYEGLTLAGEWRPLFAVNLAAEAEGRIAPSPEIPIVAPEALPMIEDGFRLGLEPYFFLLVLAVLLLCVEWVLYHRRIVE